MLKPLSLPAISEAPLVSILVASYNYEAYITEAVQSAQRQTYSKLEIIVCDDGSSDNSCDIVAALAKEDDRISLLRQENAGVAAALNRAFDVAKGEIICLLDADDTFHKDKVARVIQKMHTNSNVGFVQHAMDVVDDKGQVLKALPAHGLFEEGWLAQKLIERGGRWRNMPASALSFRREIAALLFPLSPEKLRSMADAYLYMLAPLLTEVGYLKERLSAYRLHGANLTGSTVFNATVSRKYVAGIKRVHDCVHAAVQSRNLSLPEFDTSRHLTYQEHHFMVSLFEGDDPVELKKMYKALAVQIDADDLYPEKRKRLGKMVLGVARRLPLVLRERWITWAMGGWRR